MGWGVIITLLVVGVILILIEFIFVPGTTVVGFLGAGIALAGVYFGYDTFGAKTGTVILLVSGAVVGVGLWFSIRFKVWKKFSLEDEISGKVRPVADEDIKVGDEGITISALRPSGDAEFDSKVYEVSSLEGFVNARTQVRITKISNNKIIVTPIQS